MRDKIIQLREEGKSIPQICELLNVGKGTVGYYLKDYNGKFKKRRINKKYDSIRADIGNEIIELYNNNNNIKTISKKFNLSDFFIKKFLQEQNLYKQKNRKLDIKALIEGKIQYKNPYYGSINNSIKKFLLDNNIIDYKCNECGINEWNKKPISLDLDHIDGNRNNNLKENLRLLCPNCHSQTDTWKGKNNKLGASDSGNSGRL